VGGQRASASSDTWQCFGGGGAWLPLPAEPQRRHKRHSGATRAIATCGLWVCVGREPLTTLGSRIRRADWGTGGNGTEFSVSRSGPRQSRCPRPGQNDGSPVPSASDGHWGRLHWSRKLCLPCITRWRHRRRLPTHPAGAQWSSAAPSTLPRQRCAWPEPRYLGKLLKISPTIRHKLWPHSEPWLARVLCLHQRCPMTVPQRPPERVRSHRSIMCFSAACTAAGARPPEALFGPVIGPVAGPFFGPVFRAERAGTPTEPAWGDEPLTPRRRQLSTPCRNGSVGCWDAPPADGRGARHKQPTAVLQRGAVCPPVIWTVAHKALEGGG